jgi:hypothetical protein
MRPSRSSTRLAVLALPDSYGLSVLGVAVWCAGLANQENECVGTTLTRPFTHGRVIAREDHEVVEEREPPQLRSRGPAPKLRVLLEAGLDRLGERQRPTSDADA